jgi:hypothetical protein
VDVHVPQAGDQKLAGGIDDAGSGRRLDAFPDGGNPPAGNRDGNVLARQRAGRIDDGGMLEDDALGRYSLRQGGRKENGESEQSGAQIILTRPFCSALSYSTSD